MDIDASRSCWLPDRTSDFRIDDAQCPATGPLVRPGHADEGVMAPSHTRSSVAKRLRPAESTETVSLSVVVPVYNEAATLASAMQTFRTMQLEIPFEIIAVDDGSTDGSLEILEAFADDQVIVISSDVNGGKGAALRKGFERASGDYILIQDADLEYDPADWPAMLTPVLRGGARVVYGSRFLGDRSGMKLHSYIANRALTLLTKVLFGSGITDMETCFKLVEADLLRSLPLSANRFDFEPQVTAMLLRRNERIVEVPISYAGRDKAAGKKIGFRDGVEAVAMLLRCYRS